VVIGLTPDETFQNLVEQINTNSTFVLAAINTDIRLVTITALTEGIAGNSLVFTSSSSQMTLIPGTAALEGV